MALKNQAYFTAKIDDVDVHSIKSMINYKIDSLEDRMKCVDIALAHGDKFYQEYFDKYCDTGITTGDMLLSDSNVVQSLESMANYILAKDPEYNKTESQYFVREQELDRKMKREDEFDGTNASVVGDKEDNSLFVEEKSKQNFKKSKKQSIKNDDLKRSDELGRVLNEYNTFLELIAKYTGKDSKAKGRKADTFTYKKHQGAIKDDMIICKDSMMKTHGYTLKYFSESTQPDYDRIDLTNVDHLLGGWVQYDTARVRSNGLLSFKATDDYQDDFNCLLVSMENLIKQSDLTPFQEEVVDLYQNGFKVFQIVLELDTTTDKVNTALKNIAKKVSQKAKELH